MRKYSICFFVIILACVSIITTGCSDVDENSYQEKSRFTFDGIDVELTSHVAINKYGDNIDILKGEGDLHISIIFKGEFEAGIKTEPHILIWDENRNTSYDKDQISKLEVAKIQEPQGDGYGKVWITAIIDGKELVFICDYIIGREG